MTVSDWHELQALVVAARDQADSVDPATVADLVFTWMTDGERLAALRMILPDAVRRILNDPPTSTISEATPSDGPSMSEQDPDTAESRYPSAPKPSMIRPGPVRKLGGYFSHRAYAPEFGSRMLGTLTREMVSQVSHFRQQQSDELAAKSARWEKLHMTMIEYDVEQVHDLPESLVRDILSGGVR